jgi:hypothetical protein
MVVMYYSGGYVNLVWYRNMVYGIQVNFLSDFHFFYYYQSVFWDTSQRLGLVCNYEPLQFKRRVNTGMPM